MRRSQKEYHKAYYKQNKEEINRKKRERYKTDRRYRAGILQRASVSAIMTSLKKKKTIQVVKHAGRFENVYSVSAMALVVNRNKDSLYRMTWKRPRVIPEALYVNKQGVSVYCESQMHYLRSLLHKIDFGDTVFNYTEMGLILREVWTRRFSEATLNRAIRKVLHGKKEGSAPKESTRKAIKSIVQEAYKDHEGRLTIL